MNDTNMTESCQAHLPVQYALSIELTMEMWLTASHIRVARAEQSKKKSKYQESMQSSTTPGTGYQWESNNLIIRHHKRELRG